MNTPKTCQALPCFTVCPYVNRLPAHHPDSVRVITPRCSTAPVAERWSQGTCASGWRALASKPSDAPALADEVGKRLARVVWYRHASGALAVVARHRPGHWQGHALRITPAHGASVILRRGDASYAGRARMRVHKLRGAACEAPHGV